MTTQQKKHQSHNQMIGQNQPLYVHLLVDSSGSMAEGFAGESLTKAEVAQNAVNELIEEMIDLCRKEGQILNRIFLTITMYGVSGGISSESKWIQDWYTDSEGLAEGNNGALQYVKVVPHGGTPMGQAFKLAYEDIKIGWMQLEVDQTSGQKFQAKDGFPPVVINISDGAAGDATLAVEYVSKIQSLVFSDGAPLVYNVNLPTVATAEVILPNDRSQMTQGGCYAEFLYDISSEVPESQYDSCKNLGFKPSSHCRGVVMNASSSTLIKFLNFGSQVEVGVND